MQTISVILLTIAIIGVVAEDLPQDVKNCFESLRPIKDEVEKLELDCDQLKSADEASQAWWSGGFTHSPEAKKCDEQLEAGKKKESEATDKCIELTKSKGISILSLLGVYLF